MSAHSTAENIVNEVEYLQRLEKADVPEHLREGLVRYLVHRIQPGHFLTAVLENNLLQAVARGDDVSLAGLPNLMRFLVNAAPGDASGSPETVREWLGQEQPAPAIDLSGLNESVDRACETIDELRTRRRDLLEALKLAVRTIRTWHGMGMGAAETQAWSLYQASPEMQRINAAIAKAEARA